MHLANIEDPITDALVSLLDDPTEHVTIAVNSELVTTVSFVVVVEPPDCPRLEFPMITLVGGEA